MKTVAMVLIGDIKMDGRVQKEIATLKARGLAVTLVQWSRKGVGGVHDYRGIEVTDYPHALKGSATMNFLRQILFNIFAFRYLKRRAPDYVQCNSLNTLLAGYLYRHRGKLIYDAHELFPEAEDGLRQRVWSMLERWMVHGCDVHIQPEKNRRIYFAKKHQLDPAGIALVENFPSSRYDFSPVNRLREHFSLGADKTILLCTGVLLPGRAIESMIGAMKFLDSTFVLVLLGPAFGDYKEQLASVAAEAGVEDRVLFHPAIPNVEMLDYVNFSDIGLVFYQNTNLNNYWCASNRLYEFIFCGKPVITNDYPGLREVIGDGRLGVCLAETTPEAIANGVRSARRDATYSPGESPYVWEAQEDTYVKLFA